jgi:DNA uptake protein ComE-like DNA-binding protein
MLFNKRRQALHDFIAGTVVITKNQEAIQLSGVDNLHRRNENNALVLVIPRWLVFSVFAALVVFLSLSTSHDARLRSSRVSKSIEPIEIRRPSIVNVNRATLAELITLPRISERVAQAIIDGRPYSSVDDLIRVYGIGPKTLENIRPFVKIDSSAGNLPKP